MALPVLVPDASVLLKWALKSSEEADRERAMALQQYSLSGECRIVLPSIWVYEVGNVLAQKEPRWARELLALLVGFDFEESRPHDLYPTILEIMARCKVTFYDASYHAVALETGGVLVTADTPYYRKARVLGHVITLRQWRRLP